MTIQDRFKFRVWDDEFNEFENENENGLILFADGLVVRKTGEYVVVLYNIIIEQCTGLKDKKGKLIYEGDIFKCPQGIYTIAVDDFGLWTVLDKFCNVAEWSDFVKNYLFDEDNKQIEIIGNIHENAELLDRKDVN